MPALPKKRIRGRMTFAAAARRRAQQFGPYKSLAVLLVPLLIVEPLKMAGMAFVGLGHWLGGACMIIGGYAAGLLLVDRLYRVVKSKLFTMHWCAVFAGKVQAQLARWHRRRIVEPSPADGIAMPPNQAAGSEAFTLTKAGPRAELPMAISKPWTEEEERRLLKLKAQDKPVAACHRAESNPGSHQHAALGAEQSSEHG